MNNLIVVISGPSGSGKSTIIRSLLKNRSNTEQISTYTTRAPRAGEINGEQYEFISHKKYLELLNENKLMACSKIENDYYGMPLIEDKLQVNNNKDFLIDMGVSGGIEIKEKFPQAVMIYVIPKTEEQLLKQRGDRGKTRQSRGIKQIERVLQSRKYEWLLINDDLEKTIQNVQKILNFIRKKRFEDFDTDEMYRYKKDLVELLFSQEHNIKFLTNYYKKEKEDFEIDEEKG